jgi:hypothetical protein
MFQGMLQRRAEASQVADNIAILSQVNERIEVIAEQILKTVGSDLDRLNVLFLKRMVTSIAATRLRYIGATPTPGSIIENETLQECAESFGKTFVILSEDDEDFEQISYSSDGRIAERELQITETDYERLRTYFLEELMTRGVSTDQFLAYESGFGEDGEN